MHHAHSSRVRCGDSEFAESLHTSGTAVARADPAARSVHIARMSVNRLWEHFYEFYLDIASQCLVIREIRLLQGHEPNDGTST